MNEELQGKIAIALDKMINGAPEMWQALVNELQTKNIILTIMSGIVCIVGLILFNNVWSKANWEEGNKYCIATILTGFMAFFGMLFTIMNGADALAPSIELIRWLR